MKRVIALMLVALVAPLAACGSDSNRSEVVLNFDLESVEKRLHKVGPSEQILYGWNHLRSETEFEGSTIEIELQAGVEYVNGAGPCEGRFTLTFPDESVLALAFIDCEAFTKSEASGARFSSRIRVIGGSGRFVDARGNGSYTGERRDEIGGVVRSRLALQIDLGDE